MDGKRINAAAESIKRLGKYKYAIAAALLGALLMLLPARTRSETARSIPETAPGEGVRSEIEATLASFDGAGSLRLTLTVSPGSEKWEGAVVVCEGADSAAVRLELTQALRSLTGLSADRITIVKGRPYG